MHADLVDIGWTEDHWNRIVSTVTEEAQRARVAAQMLPVAGPEDASVVAVPTYRIHTGPSYPPAGVGLPFPSRRLAIDSDPILFLTTLAIHVQLRTTEAADTQLSAALVMFRRAANYIARIEDALVFNGRPGPNAPPRTGLTGIPDVFTVTGHRATDGIFYPVGDGRRSVPIPAPPAGGIRGQPIVNAIVKAIDKLEQRAQLGPYGCVLGHELFEDICDPTSSLVLPRDRILPFLQGPLLRSSAVPPTRGAIVALGGNPIEILVASDIDVRFLQTTLEPRFVFRVSERVAVRIKDPQAIALLHKTH